MKIRSTTLLWVCHFINCVSRSLPLPQSLPLCDFRCFGSVDHHRRVKFHNCLVMRLRERRRCCENASKAWDVKDQSWLVEHGLLVEACRCRCTMTFFSKPDHPRIRGDCRHACHSVAQHHRWCKWWAGGRTNQWRKRRRSVSFDKIIHQWPKTKRLFIRTTKTKRLFIRTRKRRDYSSEQENEWSETIDVQTNEVVALAHQLIHRERLSDA